MEDYRLSVNYENIKEFLTKTEFKKTMRGVNENEVYACIRKLDEMYREKIDEMNYAYAEIAERAEELSDKLAAAGAQAVYSQDYELKSEHISNVMSEIQSVCDSLIANAHGEADRIVAQANEARLEQERYIQAEQARIEMLRSSSIVELKTLSGLLDDVLGNVRASQNTLNESLADFETTPVAVMPAVEEVLEAETVEEDYSQKQYYEIEDEMASKEPEDFDDLGDF